MKRILVPLDGSSFAEAALTAAVAIARRTGAELRIVSVQEEGREPSDFDAARRWKESYLAGVSRGRGPFDDHVTTVVREGSPGPEILAEAEAFSAQLIVIATHGRGAVSQFWLGSVTDHCLRHSRIPLLLIRPRPAAAQGTLEGFRINRVVVPVDGSEGSSTVVSVGATMAALHEAPIDLIQIADGPDEAQAARVTLGREAIRLQRRGLEASGRVVPGRHAAPAILEYAAGDLIVMGTHARPAVARAILGGVADKVVRGARGPVLVVPPEVRKHEGLAEIVATALKSGNHAY